MGPQTPTVSPGLNPTSKKALARLVDISFKSLYVHLISSTPGWLEYTNASVSGDSAALVSISSPRVIAINSESSNSSIHSDKFLSGLAMKVINPQEL